MRTDSGSRIVISGTGEWKGDTDGINHVIQMSGFRVDTLVTGMNGMVSVMGFFWSVKVGVPHKKITADWGKYRRERGENPAGKIRNLEMTKVSDGLIAIWDGESVGTKDIIEKMVSAGKPTFIYYYKTGGYEWVNCTPTRDEVDMVYCYVNNIAGTDRFQLVSVSELGSVNYLSEYLPVGIPMVLSEFGPQVSWVVINSNINDLVNSTYWNLTKQNALIENPKMSDTIMQAISLVNDCCLGNQARIAEYEQYTGTGSEISPPFNRIQYALRLKRLLESDRYPIGVFRGPYSFLSNLYPAQIQVGGFTFSTAEHYYQSMKAQTYEDFLGVAGQATPYQAKEKGRQIPQRPDFGEVFYALMNDALALKFTQNQPLSTRLILTGEKELIEGNYWGDKKWGVCNGEGENHLGVLLQAIRLDIIDGSVTQGYIPDIKPYWT